MKQRTDILLESVTPMCRPVANFTNMDYVITPITKGVMK